MSQHSERNRALLAAGTSADKLPIESYREDACCGIRTQCPIAKVCAAAGDAAARHDYCGNLLPCRRCCHRSCAGVLRVVLPSGAGISRLVRPLRQLTVILSTLVYGLRVSAADLHARPSSDRAETHTLRCLLRYTAPKWLPTQRHRHYLGPFRTPLPTPPTRNVRRFLEE